MALPDFLLLTDQNLQYLDVLVYTAFKWFNNDAEDKCFPMHETVGKLAGLSRRFVINSVKRLEDAGIISVVRSKKIREPNHYYFAPPHRNKRLEKIPKDFFKLTADLSSCERAMLLCLRQFFHHGFAQFIQSKPTEFFAKWLGLSTPTVRKQLNGLFAKGYISKRYVNGRSQKKNDVWLYLTAKLNWDFSGYAKVPRQSSTYKELILS